MGPRLTSNYKANHALGDPILRGEYTLCDALPISGPDAQNKLIGQLSPSVRFALVLFGTAHIQVSVLANTILYIVRVRSIKQMFGIAARWVIAFVKYQKFGILSICKKECNPTGSTLRSFSIGGKESAIPTVFVDTSCPRPTFIRASDIDVTPELDYLVCTYFDNWLNIVYGHVIFLHKLMCQVVGGQIPTLATCPIIS